MKMTRRQLFTAAFGAAQVALLSRYGLREKARAARRSRIANPISDRPRSPPQASTKATAWTTK